MNLSTAAASQKTFFREQFFLARQPILDRGQSLIAYELLFRSAGTGPAGVDDNLAATASVILNTLAIGVDQVIGNALGFINVDAALLMSDAVDFLPASRVVLEILETVIATPELIERITALQQAGYTFALDDVVSDTADVRSFMPFVSIVKIDITDLSPAALGRLCADCKQANKRLLAEKVETLAQFQTCVALGFDFFQGYYFARPTVLQGKKFSPAQSTVLELMHLLTADADNIDIEQAIKKSVPLSLSLLKMVNTPAYGVTRHSDSIKQAIAVLGRQQLQRWLQILLYAEPNQPKQFVSPLLSMATTRGRFLELLVRELQPLERALADTAFTIGVMSLLDALFGTAMATVLDEIAVSDDVKQALLQREGLCGELLKIAESLEAAENDDTTCKSFLDEMQLSLSDLLRIQLDAYKWSNEIVQASAARTHEG